MCGKLLNTGRDWVLNLAAMEASTANIYGSVPRCAICNEAIGVYEPAFVIECGKTRRTSLAREPMLSGHSTLVHRNCAPEVPAGDR